MRKNSHNLTYTVLDMVEQADTLWNIKAPLGARVKKIREVGTAAHAQWEILCNQGGYHLEAGMLLAVVNILAGLLRGAGYAVPWEGE